MNKYHMNVEYLQEFRNAIGNTSLINIPCPALHGKIYAKCEWENPTGSIKDRTAYFLMRELITTHLNENKEEDLHVLEYSGGSLAVSLAVICKKLDIPLTLVLSAASSRSLLDKIAALHAEIILVDKSKGFWGVMEETIRLSKENPSWSFLYQHENKANLLAHRMGTGQEIVKQLAGKKIDAWVASVGTGGTLIGAYETIKQTHPDVELHLVTPAELPYGSEQPPNDLKKYAGSGGLGLGKKQTFVASQEMCITKQWSCTFQETLVEMKNFYDQTGIRIGTSAAANVIIAKKVASKLGPESTIVTVFPDKGSAEEWEEADNL
ncbi:pyridoxal-phosphate dependent enzyme [Brevibacillus laterosporus]|nr:pyridoxal-phosphate dependent enzyme [Brevibacillus laterosporus]MBM7111514.1 Cysteine synthase [Brevibacillus laterosporus]